MILDDIDDHPAAYDDPPTHIIADDPDALSRADWHLRKLAALEARKAETARVFNAYHDADAGLDDRVDWETAEQWLREEA